MERALSSIQCHPRLVPRLTPFRRINNVKHFQNSKIIMTHFPSSYPYQFSTKCNTITRSRPPFHLPHGTVPSHLTETDGDDPQAIDTVLGLYSAIRKRNPQEFSELISDDCKCTCNFTPLCNVVEGKEHVVGFVTTLFGSMGDYMEFKIDTSCYGKGDNVGIMWHLEWKGNNVPFGKGCTFYSCENKDGKLLIRDMEMFMESFVKLGLLQLRLMGMLMFILSKCVNLSMKWIDIGTSI